MLLRCLKALLSVLSKPEPIRRSPFDPLKGLHPMDVAYCSAVLDIGEREDPMGSNSGAYVEGLRSEVKLPRLAGGEWCSVFCSVHLHRAGIDIRSRRARRLVTQMAKQGRAVQFADLEPGMCGLSLHKRSGGWHVRLWRCEEEDGQLAINCVGGNERHQVRGGKFAALSYCLSAKMMATT